MAAELTLLTLRCRDIEASRTFFETLGLDVSSVQHKDGSRHYCCNAGAQVLELYPKRRGDTNEVRLGFRVDNLAETLPRLTALGAEVVQSLGAPVVRYAVVRDPDGHMIELRG